MSPEQCRCESAAPPSDVFAAGVVLFEMITGHHPFRADSPLDTAHAIVWSEPPPLTRLSPDVPPSINSLIMKMLSKDAQARPAAAEVAEALLNNGVGAANVPRAPRVFSRYLVAGLILAVALLCGLWFTRSPKRSNPTFDIQISPLASLRGSESRPSFSADGTRVAFAFAGENNATPHIYIKSLSDAKLTQLTSDFFPDFHPVFSPDGARLAFLRRADGRLRVMVMPASGGAELQVGEILDILREYLLMTWDADGKNLLVADRAGESRSEIALFQISFETGARRQITFPPAGASDWMPAVSPDGRSLGFARVLETGRGDLWAIPLSGGGRERRLTVSHEVFFCWAWSSDGRDLLIAYRRSGSVHLWRQPVNGGPQVRVAGLDDQVMALSVARTGNLMAYVPGTEEDYNIWKYPLPPSKDRPKPLVASAAFDGDARYSPDGARIAFASTRSGQSNIWICASDGSDLRQLTSLGPGGYTAGSPSWSPDGRWIAFDSRSPQTESGIFVLDVLGGKPKRLTGPGPSDIIPSWSRDSHWIYFSSDRGGNGLQIWKVPSSGGEPVQVTHKGGLEVFESPDGRFLYYTKRGRKNGFWRMPMGGGEETFVPELASVANRSWENTPQGIYFAVPSKVPVLKLFHFSGGAVTRVMDLPVQPVPVHRGITIAPDGRSFLYMQADASTSNIMVVNNFH
jgi:Tol biopolymer transport system component